MLNGLDQPELIFYEFGRNRNMTESSNVVSAKNETGAEFNTLFRPKPKPKINNAENMAWSTLLLQIRCD